jgi:hypothetical protein
VLISAVVSVFAPLASATAQTPAAVVEEVKGKVAGVEFMDYVERGKVIKLGPKDVIVLGYMKSCWRETITGGTVVVGDEESMVHLGKLERARVECDASHLQLTSREAGQSAATVFRTMSPAQQAASPPRITLHGLSPLIEVGGRGTLVIERLDAQGERHELTVGPKSLVRGKFYDLAKARKTLTPGATYVATFGTRKRVFRIDPQARPGSTAIIGRLLRMG